MASRFFLQFHLLLHLKKFCPSASTNVARVCAVMLAQVWMLATGLRVIIQWHSSQSISGLRTDHYNYALSLRTQITTRFLSAERPTRMKTYKGIHWGAMQESTHAREWWLCHVFIQTRMGKIVAPDCQWFILHVEYSSERKIRYNANMQTSLRRCCTSYLFWQFLRR